MLIKLTNTINSIVRRGLSVIRKGLKMWLPFENSEILGEELVVNGDFATDIIGWAGSDAAAELEWDNGRVKVTNGDGTAAGVVSVAINVEIGKTYLFSFESSQGTSVNESTSFGFGTSTTNVNKFWFTGATGFTTDGLHTYMYTSDFTGTGYVVVKNATITINEYMFFDNISVKEVTQIAPDKSGVDNEILGENLTEDYDFTSGWSTLDTTVNDANTFTSDPDGGLYKTLVEVGKTYSLTIEGTTDSAGVQVRNAIDGELYYDSGATGAFSDTVTFIATQTNIYVKNKSAGEATITTLKIKEVTQAYAEPNGAKLFTGKALSFDGTGDSYYVDFGNTGVGLKTLAFWINLDSTTEKVLQLTSTQSVEVSSGTITLNGTWTGSTIYVDATATSTIADSNWKRVVITTTSAITVNDLELGRIGSSYGDFILSDLQIFDSAWTQADVTFDYNNPQHLVTDNSDSSIALSNLKGYWHLSEGDGAINYDSSGEGNDGTINGATWEDQQATIPQLGLMDWSKGSNLFDYSEDFSQWSTQSGTTATYNTTETLSPDGTNNATKLVSDGTTGIFNTSNSVSGVVSRFVYLKSVVGNVSVLLKDSSSVTTTVSVTEQWQRFYLIGDKGTSTQGLFIDDIPATGIYIWGAQLEEGSSTTASAYRRTNGTAVTDATLIADPNNPSDDILGNSVRLREHSLNLDGSGYAEVPDADTLDFGTGDFSLECWLKIGEANIERILDKRDSSSGYTLYRTASNVLKLELDDGTGNSGFTISNAQSSGVWLHVVVVGVRSGDATCYIDADAETPIDISGKSGNLDSGSPLIIGADAPDGNNYWSTDLIDDVRIYNRALSSDEVEQNYKAGLNKHKASSSFSDDFSSDYGF